MQDTFSEAVAQFQAFLADNKYSRQIIWLSPENVLISGKRFLYVKPPSSSEDAELARQSIEAGMKQKLGVVFSTLCEVEGATCCAIWFPEDADEAKRMLMPADGSLKMNVQDEGSRIPGILVRNSLYWHFLCYIHKLKLPLRSLLLSRSLTRL
ncbi:MAG TPA: hypothetical protein VGH37_15105 [Candidatus Acidoferrum sp.]|jgi:hypothetical protein